MVLDRLGQTIYCLKALISLLLLAPIFVGGKGRRLTMQNIWSKKTLQEHFLWSVSYCHFNFSTLFKGPFSIYYYIQIIQQYHLDSLAYHFFSSFFTFQHFFILSFQLFNHLYWPFSITTFSVTVFVLFNSFLLWLTLHLRYLCLAIFLLLIILELFFLKIILIKKFTFNICFHLI